MEFNKFLEGKNAETYLDEKIETCKSITKLPRELKNCVCCERHKINFPILGNPIKTNLFKDTTPKTCSCPCRHIARQICREWDRVNEVDDIGSEEYSEDSDSTGSLEDFIVPDEGLKKKECKELEKILNNYRDKKRS